MSRRLRTSTPLLLIAFSIAGAAAAEPAKTELQLELRSREKVSDKLEEYRAVIAPATWDARETAIVVCDMWDRHWCAGATERVAQMAPRMNEVLKAARARGVLIIHCPSGVVHRYNDTPQRKLAQQAPPLDLPRPIQPWSHRDGDRETALPIDDSDGGCDCQLRCRQGGPWKAQIETLEIAAGDAVTDNAEAFYLMKQRGIKNVVVMGVHTNMCVLGRPFSIRQMVHQGQNVVLMRDMTDTMYNSRMRPFVSHFTGTDLVVEHIEKYWCPTITSAAFLGGEEFRFPADRRPHLAIVMAEPEYGTDRTLPEFARTHLGRDFRVSLVFADADDGNQLPGVEVLDKADVALFSIRRRTPPAKQMAVIRRFIEAGKPLVAVRTSNHAFSLRGQPPPVGHAAWEEFDREVIGGNYHGHYPNKARGEDRTIIWPLKEAGEHPILAGIPQAEQIVPSGLYKNRPLAESSTPLLMGRFGSQQPHEPVAWTNQTKWGGKVFYAAVGSPEEIADKNIARLLVNAVHWAVGRPADADPQPQEPPGQVPEPDASQQGADPQPAAQQAAVDYRQWTLLAVPGTWEEQSGGKLEYDGMAWYRCHAKVPAAWKKEYLELSVEQVDNAHEAYFNGQRIGRGGNFPPDYVNAVDHAGRYQVPANLVAADQYNEIVIRVYDHGGRGGFKGPAPALFNERQVIDLTGKWEFRTGDDLDWLGGARERADQAAAPFEKVVRAAEIAPRAASVRRAPGSQTPEEAARGFQVPADLRWESVLAEPEIRQPVSISFDERGRLWVVQYQQYPHPAGLKMVSRDNYWRAVYDKVPPPPPNHFVGKDKITIHTDTNGDGRFDEHKTFVDGLNICTAAVPGRGGVWVLNPPYLLFYPDANRDDVPDGDPEVHLQGFGLEDTHSTVNSLRFGPDGWLYAAQGSTVSGQVKRPGTTEEPVRTMGQLIWRYHPEQRRYEVFAEGGGNSYGVEFDAQGRLYSGHNGGNTRGFHFVQGGYYRKGFGKHGALSNPYTFGFFEAMKHHEVPRFSHTFLIYESHGLPPEYRGMLYGLEPMQGQIVRSKMSRDRSSFMTEDVDRVVRTDDDWFRPVDVKEGPDGAIYVADWYDSQINHYRNHEGKIDLAGGRVYRLSARQAAPTAARDLASLTSSELVALLDSESKWTRQTVLRLLGDRRDAALIVPLSRQLKTARGQLALETLWALNLSGGLDEAASRNALRHAEPQVRAWTVRLICDERQVSAGLLAELVALAEREEQVEVRSQLASSARRLPADACLAVVAKLAAHQADADDIHVPLLLWWAIEAQAADGRDAILTALADEHLWRQPLFEQHVVERLIRRYAASGVRADLLTCAKLLKLAPDQPARAKLMRGFEAAYQGRSLAGLPDELIEALAAAGGGSLMLKVRRGDGDAIAQALTLIADDQTETRQRRQLIEVFGQVSAPASVPIMLQVLARDNPPELRAAALAALSAYGDPQIGDTLIELLPKLDDQSRPIAVGVLSGRAGWAAALLQAVEQDKLDKRAISDEHLRKMQLLNQESVNLLIGKLYGEIAGATTAEMQQTIARLAEVIDAESGSPYRGKQLYQQSCAKCHRLFDDGGEVGPDLTAYNRDDVSNMLLAIINPSAEIREGYENFVVFTDDGRTLTGFIADQDAQVIELRGTDAQSAMIERDAIDEIQPLGRSVMPDGLLHDFSDQQIRDLFAYLRSTQPLND